MMGLLTAFGANACFTSRSLFGKQMMKKLDNLNLYHYMSVTSFVCLLPLWALTDLRAFLADPALLQPLTQTMLRTMFLCGSLHWTYNNVSALMLSYVSPLTHSVFNVQRRVLVIVVTTLYFGRKPPLQNIVGIATVFAGVFLYLRARAAADAAKEKGKAE
jgi:drug/metabolite transporter (DMT)-like permease